MAIGEQLLATEKARADRDDAALAVRELRDALPQMVAALHSMSSRLSSLEAQTAELARIAAAPRIRRPVRDTAGLTQYVIDELAGGG